jgi:hypothetical protein
LESLAAEKNSKKDYDALYHQILQNLPEKSLLKVDSARGGGFQRSPESLHQNLSDLNSKGKVDPLSENVRADRERALGKLDPEIKLRVEKAIQAIENRKKERELEFKE